MSKTWRVPDRKRIMADVRRAMKEDRETMRRLEGIMRRSARVKVTSPHKGD